jgi:quinol monooxygenase YgiN
MHIVHVFIRVKPEYVDAFKSASLENAQNSVKEPGIARFDFIQQQDDVTRFVLLEVYLDERIAPAAHKQTEHYARWRDAVAEMMAEPRYAIKYNNIFPDNSGW